MNMSRRFIDHPIATSLIMIAILLSGIAAFFNLPVAALPAVEFPTIQVNANLPGADPETMASSVATPLEKQFARISHLAQMTSTSTLGQTSIALQFDLTRDIDAAAQDVSAAINAAGGQLPKNLPSPPIYQKSNPADPPIIILGLYSDTLPIDQVDNYADSMLAQQISQMPGVGFVNLFGEQKPAVRVQIDPAAIANQGISLEDVRTVLTQTSVNAPKGSIDGAHQAATIASNDQLMNAADYRQVVIAYRKGAPVYISDIGTVIDGVENTKSTAWMNGHRGIGVAVNRQPGANVIQTADAIKARLPQLTASLPPSLKIVIMDDKTRMIRASVGDIEFTLMITIVLVIMVIFVFLRKLWATIIPALAVPLSLTGAFGVMYLIGYGIDNLSLMALTIAVGFIVDDAIVMIENIVRHIEEGKSAFEAAVIGSRQIGFTIVSMTFSLIAVFTPLLLMGGIIGRLFREFAVTVSVAVLISGVVSLTLTPAMCAHFLHRDSHTHGRVYMAFERAFNWMLDHYAALLRVALRHQKVVGLSVIATLAVTAALFVTIPKGFFPDQDTGLIRGTTEAAQDISFAEMMTKQELANEIASRDPAVASVVSMLGTGGGGSNTGRITLALKPFGQRDASANEVISRLRPQFTKITGFDNHMQAAQDISVGARFARTQFQYTLQDQDYDELNRWSETMLAKMKALPQLEDVTSDAQTSGARIMVKVNRDTAARLGVMQQQIDDTLYDAFGQRQVATIFTQNNQYHVILEIDPKLQGSPDALNTIYVKSVNGQQVPLSSIAAFEPANSPLSIGHQGQFPATTLSFNLARGVALSQAIDLIKDVERDVKLPLTVVPTFQGTAQAFQDSLVTMPYLVGAAIIAVYIVLGILYESYIHPLTILSTIPSAGVGALLMLSAFGIPLDMMGLIGILLLIGIVKKNAIMMVDFAIDAEKQHGLSPHEAIYKACLVRFRPIMMTTMCALLGGVPLIVITGAGAELRRPLGLAIVGGLLLSQMLTLFTTPVVYLYMHRIGERLGRGIKHQPALAPAPGAAE
jgi:hydrophobe/amphiphile efflux-1 (HAE1) family protein